MAYIIDFEACKNKLESASTWLKNLLTNTDDSEIDGVKTYKTVIGEKKDKLGSKYKDTEIYQKGDLVTYNGDIYLSKIDNNTESPDNAAAWQASSNTDGGGEVIGADIVLWDKDNGIIKDTGNIIDNVEKLQDGLYKFTLKNNYDNGYIVIPTAYYIDESNDGNWIIMYWREEEESNYFVQGFQKNNETKINPNQIHLLFFAL